MARSRLVLLDANIVIQLHRMGIWTTVCARYEIALTEAVRDESKYFERDDGAQERIDLAADFEAGAVELIEVSPSDFAKFQAQFDPGYVERLDDGECESLAFLTRSQSDAAECLICSADAIVWRVLGNLHLRERGISLEEMLSQVDRQLACLTTTAGLSVSIGHPGDSRRAFGGLGGARRPWGFRLGWETVLPGTAASPDVRLAPCPSSRLSSSMEGTRFGPYQLLAVLGGGGMAEVFRAEVTGTVPGLEPGCAVALKVIHAHLLEPRGFFERFLREWAKRVTGEHGDNPDA